MHLSELTAKMHNVETSGAADPAIIGITADSREVESGFLFAAMPGTKNDGADFIRDAVERNAAAILVPTLSRAPVPPDIPVVVSRDIRAAYGEALDAFYDHPSGSLDLIGVTGTNGKTTTAYLLRHIYNAAGRRCGMLGTVEYDYGDRAEPAPLTTPDAHAFTRALAEMRDYGCVAAAVEVSSHALAQERVWPHRFSGAVFTNLTRDHLDYHGDMESYLQAKRSLFTRLDRNAIAVANFRDPAAAEIVRDCQARVLGFVVDDATAPEANPQTSPPANPPENAPPLAARARIVSGDLSGQTFVVDWNGREVEFRIPLVGAHNVENCLGCFLMATGQGIGAATVKDALADFPGVPGRLERIESRTGAKAFVDYSHTDGALRSVLSVLRPLVKGKLIVVFGCGGDRDAGKRPMMAKAAEAFADRVVVTSDNPRTEDPEKIIDAIMPGFADPARVLREADRPAAVRAAVLMAGPDDAVLVAGKGHEDYQIVGTEKRHMDDRELVRDAFAMAGRSGE